jgi:hypothetical protein
MGVHHPCITQIGIELAEGDITKGPVGPNRSVKPNCGRLSPAIV